MIILFVYLTMVACAMIMIPIALIFLAGQLSQAAKYCALRKQLLELSEVTPKDPNEWTVTYRVKGKTMTLNVKGGSEAEAVMSAIKAGVPHDKIQSVSQ